jgi:hypothetical protein
MVPSSIYNAAIIPYNSYEEFRFKLHYINVISDSIWRGSSMGYAYYCTSFHTITVYFVTSRDLYTHYIMEVSNSSGRIEKFNGRPGTICLREFKVTFSIVVCELELKYGINYTKGVRIQTTKPLCAL